MNAMECTCDKEEGLQSSAKGARKPRKKPGPSEGNKSPILLNIMETSVQGLEKGLENLEQEKSHQESLMRRSQGVSLGSDRETINVSEAEGGDPGPSME